MSNSLPSFVKIVEVGPRDGLQNEPNNIPANVKIELINQLSKTGLKTIEATSFVSKKWVPQFSDAKQVFTEITKAPNIQYPVLVPNKQGADDAIAVNANCIAVITSPSTTFCQRNTNCSVDESLERIEQIIKHIDLKQTSVRAYISCVLGCPYEGKIDIEKVVETAKYLHKLGCYEISLGDTIGVGTPMQACKLIEHVAREVPISKLAVHFHNTYGQALANIYAVLNLGVNIIDSSVAGLGGCPYAKGASGNIATEEVIYMLNGMNIKTGVSLEKLLLVKKFIRQFIGHSEPHL